MELAVLTAAVAGYLAGGIPTADWVASRRSIDLRAVGSGNPGANNAMRIGGWKVGAAVLGAEMTKGAVVVAAASTLGPLPAATAGIGAVVGNILNPYRRFQGGQGLGITAGVLAAGWPIVLIPAVGVIALVSQLFRSTAIGTLTTVAGLLFSALIWSWRDWPVAWGVPSSLVPVLAVGLAVAICPKQLRMLRAEQPAAGTTA